MEDKKIILNELNEEGLKNGPSRLQKNNYGKGKIIITLDKVLVGAAACLEALREIPGFEYLKTMTTGNIVTKFNVWFASITAKTPDLTGLTPEEIFELGKQTQATGTVDAANGVGLVFSAILEFIVQHPTVAVLGITAIFGILSLPFKALCHKISNNKVKKMEMKKS